MFRIKICGITNPGDARSAVAVGADAIGLNFYPGSKRCVSLEQAEDIVRAVGSRMEKVGVFVNQSPAVINQAARRLGLSWVQLHGDEPASALAEILPEFGVIRVYRVNTPDLRAIAADVAACEAAGRRPDAVLIDAGIAGQFGGTGETVAWHSLANYQTSLGQVPLILAGGLTPENVGEAIRQVRPSSVDTASGVESAPGQKDARLVGLFVQLAAAALAE